MLVAVRTAAFHGSALRRINFPICLSKSPRCFSSRTGKSSPIKGPQSPVGLHISNTWKNSQRPSHFTVRAMSGKGGKRKALKDEGGGAGQSTKIPKGDQLVDAKRVRVLKEGEQADGPVIYWMSRDMRVQDNWALLYAIQEANKAGVAVSVAYNLVDKFLGAGARQFGFMLRGLRLMEPKLAELNIPFFFLTGDMVQNISTLVKDTKARLLVTDFSPMRIGREWREKVMEEIECPFHEVDAHNIVPVWEASNKREHAARTIRPKIHRLLPEFLTEFPETSPVAKWDLEPKPQKIDWDGILNEALSRGTDVPEVSWIKPGEDAAIEALTGDRGFLSKSRLGLYATKRNDPAMPQAQSNLSPYFHFGFLAPQRAAIEANKFKKQFKESVDSFIEEAVIRRELSDNYCYYEPHYDSLQGADGWARQTLDEHANDKREFMYSREEFEKGKTHDELWNAAQMEMVYSGKMHNFMRMYWAKKILEWAESPEEALAIAIYLNDKYELDGRDPNGYVGCLWSIGGIHDHGWKERPVFGKIRYMNYNGCKRKFNVQAYETRIHKMVREVKKEWKAKETGAK